jgi:methylated-DNA-[protein]-cysteine S-methyltransferase
VGHRVEHLRAGRSTRPQVGIRQKAAVSRPAYYIELPSGFGTFCVVWQEMEDSASVVRVFLSNEQASAATKAETAFAGAARRSHPTIDGLAEGMQRLLVGEPVVLDLGLAAWEIVPEFQRAVLLAEAAIPRGWVSTYGRIARHLGVEGGARAVGNALARNPFPLIVPCHRAIRSDGRLGGNQGGLAMKRALLEFEGATISEDGRVCNPRAFY